jgi:hypothetical protein
MRTLHLVVVVAALGLVACSESPSAKGPKERSGLSSGMSEDIWKAYSGAESGGVSDDAKDKPQEKK